jgi:hypothetical protein
MKNLLRFLVYAPALFTIMVGAQTSVSQEKGIGSRESFNRGWLFARFGPMPDG